MQSAGRNSSTWTWRLWDYGTSATPKLVEAALQISQAFSTPQSHLAVAESTRNLTRHRRLSQSCSRPSLVLDHDAAGEKFARCRDRRVGS